MNGHYSKEEEKTVKKRKRKSFEKLPSRKNKAVLPETNQNNSETTTMTKRQDTRPDLVFSGQSGG